MSTTTITDTTDVNTTDASTTAATSESTTSESPSTPETSATNTTVVLPESTPSDSAPGAPTNPDARPYSYPAPVAGDRYGGISIASFVIGLVSIVSSWTFIAPLTGLILGIVALRRKTTERTLAIWGVALNGTLLALTVLILIAVLLFMGAIGFAGIAGVLAA